MKRILVATRTLAPDRRSWQDPRVVHRLFQCRAESSSFPFYIMLDLPNWTFSFPDSAPAGASSARAGCGSEPRMNVASASAATAGVRRRFEESVGMRKLVPLACTSGGYFEPTRGRESGARSVDFARGPLDRTSLSKAASQRSNAEPFRLGPPALLCSHEDPASSLRAHRACDIDRLHGMRRDLR